MVWGGKGCRWGKGKAEHRAAAAVLSVSGSRGLAGGARQLRGLPRDHSAWDVQEGVCNDVLPLWGLRDARELWSTTLSQWKPRLMDSQASISPTCRGSSWPVRVTQPQELPAHGCRMLLMGEWHLGGEQLHLLQRPVESPGFGDALPPHMVPVSIPLALLPWSSQSAAGLLIVVVFMLGKSYMLAFLLFAKCYWPMFCWAEFDFRQKISLSFNRLFYLFFPQNLPSHRLLWGSSPTAFLTLKIIR